MEANNDLELQTGVRTTYTHFPNCQQKVEHFEVPLAALVTPCKRLEDMPQMQYSPVRCVKCKSVLNPNVGISFQQKTWSCNLCASTNTFPAFYKQNLAPGMLPVEMTRGNEAIEYVIGPK